MIRLLAFAWAAGVAATALAFPPPPPEKEKKAEVKRWEFPKLDAKEWKKQKSGLEIWETVVGKGTAAKAGETVTIRYKGWLTDGTVFDTTEKANAGPATFPLNRLIKGWQEGVPGMKPGGVRRLKIPASLAYGAKGAGDDVPPNATIIFEIELVESN
ncbi:MAG TPA: FKBP-type peptidyl-prolyl cis-trans isomerase [Fimbriiglobus sp.]|jgi:FKBP-type peptidyl-prolyl cis-trans isomerase